MAREEAKRAVRLQGGKTPSSVSGETDFLVVGASPGQTKLEDADAHGVEQINEDTFLRRLGRT
jgi:DNA ligase (NAD+)